MSGLSVQRDLATSKIFVFDLHTNPGQPRLEKVITDFVTASGGVVGPHTIDVQVNNFTGTDIESFVD